MPAPTLTSTTLNTAASQISTVWGAAVAVNHSAASPTLTVLLRGAAVPCDYLSGDGTTTIVWALRSAGVIFADETVAIGIPGGIVVDSDPEQGQPNLAIIGDPAVTNNSTVATPSGARYRRDRTRWRTGA